MVLHVFNRPAYRLRGVSPSRQHAHYAPVDNDATDRYSDSEDDTTPSTPTATPSDDVGITCPFPQHVVDAEYETETAITATCIMSAGKRLRDSREAWWSLVRHVRVPALAVGSMASDTELSVVVDTDGTLSALTTTRDAARAVARATHVLRARGAVQPEGACLMANAVIQRVATANLATLSVAHRVVASHIPVVMVTRVSLKPLQSLCCNTKTGAVWFDNCHANACVIDSERRLIVFVEPLGRECIPGLLSFLVPAMLGSGVEFRVGDDSCSSDSASSAGSSLALSPSSAAIVYRVLHNYGFVRQLQHVVFDSAGQGLNACTLWAAIAALFILANVEHLTDARFHAALQWAYTHQAWLLRLTLRSLA